MIDDIVTRLRLRTDPSQMLMSYPARPALDMLCHEAAAIIERQRLVLHEWDALIKHQYSGSQQAMSDMTDAAQATAHLLHGKEPYPEPRIVVLETALRRIIDYGLVSLNDLERACTALGEKTDDAAT